MVVIVMGVSGAGKTTLGSRLAAVLGARFCEADDLQPASNIAKEHRGEPLTDAEREVWLARLGAMVDEWIEGGEDAVLAFTALRQSWREQLARGRAEVRFVYLKGPQALIRTRHAQRSGHFFPASLLASHFARLQEPSDAITVDISLAPESIVAAVSSALRPFPAAGPGLPDPDR